MIIGTTDLAAAFAEGVLDSGEELAAVVSMPESARPANPAQLAEFARSHGVGYREVADINAPESVALLKSLEPDYIISAWSRIVGSEVLDVPTRFVIGSHPTALPRNRGRHPLHWLVVLGFAATELTFFRMAEGVDTGRVLLCAPFEVDAAATIGQVTQRMSEAGRSGVASLCAMLRVDPDPAGTPQDERDANYWRKRTPHDVLLDPRMSAETVVRTVRSYAPPFPGAIILYENDALRIAAAEIVGLADVGGSPRIADMEYGRVVRVDGSRLLVKFADAVVALTPVGDRPPSVAEGVCIHPPTKYLLDHPGIFDGVLEG